jgi:hypothetical protein
MTVLEEVAGITFTQFGNKDVVRHPLVQRVVSAYDAFEQRNRSAWRRGSSVNILLSVDRTPISPRPLTRPSMAG